MTAATVENPKPSKGPEAQASAGPVPVHEAATTQSVDIRKQPEGYLARMARFVGDSFGNPAMCKELANASMGVKDVVDRWFDPFGDATKSDLTQALIPTDNLKRIGIEMINDKMGTTVPEFLRAVNAGMGGMFRTEEEKKRAVCLVLGGMMWDAKNTVFSRNPVEQASMVKMLSAVSTPYDGIFQVQRIQVFDTSPATRPLEAPPTEQRKKGKGGHREEQGRSSTNSSTSAESGEERTNSGEARSGSRRGALPGRGRGRR